MNKSGSWADKVTKDKKGHVILWQSPNLPVIVWAVATVASKLISKGQPHQALALIAFGAIFAWAWLEIVSGVNYFRRVVGIMVLVISILSRLH